MLDDVEQTGGAGGPSMKSRGSERAANDILETALYGAPGAGAARLDQHHVVAAIGELLGHEAVAAADVKDGAARRKARHRRADGAVAVREPERRLLDAGTELRIARRVRDRLRDWARGPVAGRVAHEPVGDRPEVDHGEPQMNRGAAGPVMNSRSRIVTYGSNGG